MPASCIYIRKGRRRRGYYATLSARLAPSGNLPESSPSRVGTRAGDEESDEENGNRVGMEQRKGREGGAYREEELQLIKPRRLTRGERGRERDE